jgi:hypothetical protein
MTHHDVEQKLKDLATATAPTHSLASRVMERVNKAPQPRRPSFFPLSLRERVGVRGNYERLRHSPIWRAAAVIAIAAGIAVIVIELRPQSDPPHPTPLVTAHQPSSDVLAVRVLDIRRVDFKSPDTLDTLLRNSSSAPSPEPFIRVSDLSRNDLNLY